MLFSERAWIDQTNNADIDLVWWRNVLDPSEAGSHNAIIRETRQVDSRSAFKSHLIFVENFVMGSSITFCTRT